MHLLGSAVRKLCLSWIVRVRVKRLLLLVSIREFMARGLLVVVILISFCSSSCPRQGELLKNPEFIFTFVLSKSLL